jgi:hypothetical protein
MKNDCTESDGMLCARLGYVQLNCKNVILSPWHPEDEKEAYELTVEIK